MSVQTEINRLNTAKADMKTALATKGIVVPEGTHLDGFAQQILDGPIQKHASTHAKGGSDEITLEMLGAAAKAVSFVVNLQASNWAGNGPYTQTVAVANLTGDRFENPDVIAEFGEDLEAEQAEWDKVNQVKTISGGLVFTCLNEAPEIDLTIIVKVRD